MRNALFVIAALLLTMGAVNGQERPAVPWRVDAPAMELTGNAKVDFVGQMELLQCPSVEPDSMIGSPTPHKSPWIAGGLSLVVPGAGEFYSESYVKSAVFFAVEVAAWVVAYTYDKKGDNQTNFFQNFAEQHWSVWRYATYAQQLAPAGTYIWQKNPTFNPNLPPWQQVNWDVLNQMERDIGLSGGTGSYYSHILPPHGDQQYYELIGKYPQFNQGWDDANPNLSPPDYATIVANLSPTLTWYSGERAKANTYYTTASTVIGVAIVNHVVSALDAALTAASFNRKLHAEAGLQRVPYDNTMVDLPVLKLRYDF